MTKLHEMSLAISDVEFAVGNFTDIVELFEGADDNTTIKINLGAIRQLVRCYPALNKIVNDPSFTCKEQ